MSAIKMISDAARVVLIWGIFWFCIVQAGILAGSNDFQGSALFFIAASLCIIGDGIIDAIRATE